MPGRRCISHRSGAIFMKLGRAPTTARIFKGAYAWLLYSGALAGNKLRTFELVRRSCPTSAVSLLRWDKPNNDMVATVKKTSRVNINKRLHLVGCTLSPSFRQRGSSPATRRSSHAPALEALI